MVEKGLLFGGIFMRFRALLCVVLFLAAEDCFGQTRAVLKVDVVLRDNAGRW